MPGGRPLKEGLDYFSFDTTVFSDPKIVQLISEHPDKGLEVYIRLLVWIYKEYGYFMECNDRILKQLVGTTNLNGGLNRMKEILSTCLNENLFDQNKYNQYGILTSRSIQDRYLNVVSRRKRILIIQDFAIFNLALIQKLQIEKVAFFIRYDNIHNQAYENGRLREDFRDVGQVVLMSSPETPASATVLPLPQNPKENPKTDYDLDSEKQKFFADVEKIHSTARMFKIGTWEGREFKPNIENMELLMNRYLDWMIVKGNKHDAPEMARHFASWLEKRDIPKTMAEAREKNTSNLHVGKRDWDDGKSIKSKI